MLQKKKESRKHRKRGIAIERCVRRSVDALFGRSKLDSSRSTRKQWDNCISVKPQNVDMLDILFSKTFILSGGGHWTVLYKHCRISSTFLLMEILYGLWWDFIVCTWENQNQSTFYDMNFIYINMVNCICICEQNVLSFSTLRLYMANQQSCNNVKSGLLLSFWSTLSLYYKPVNPVRMVLMWIFIFI